MSSPFQPSIPTSAPLGPVMIDVVGTALSDDDRRRLAHPLVGGVILFTRNFRDVEQLCELTAAIRAVRPLPIAVDHEGGRVQRFRDGFTRLPAMARLGEAWERDPHQARLDAEAVGYVLASELRACGIDFSFAPVLDLDWGRSGVVGERAFHRDPAVVAELAGALIAGLKAAGMAGGCGKHFPGHGWAEADSHVAMPQDERSLGELMAADLAPYRALDLAAVMPAHVVYPQVDDHPAGFSPVWHGLLRREFGQGGQGFDGIVFSDDLSMEGASVAGDVVARAEAAYGAGCDMLLVCNKPETVDDLLARWHPALRPESTARLSILWPHCAAPTRAGLVDDPVYKAARARIDALAAQAPQPAAARA